jgi:hypothetical protein
MGGAEASYFLRDTPFKAITITSAQAQTVRIAFGSGEAGTRRTSGVVQVVDGNRSRTIAGGSYMWRPSSTGANFNAAQIYNPAGSGRNIVVDAILITANAAAPVSLARTSTQLANNSINPAQNLLIGSASATVALLKVESLASLPYATTTLVSAFVQANNGQDLTTLLRRPIVIQPGQGLVMLSEAVAAAISGGVSFFEESI